jgi:hypothetical protein
MCNANYSVFLLRISVYIYACLVCFMQLRKTQRSMGACDSVIVVLITLWKLKFLAYLLNVTQRFVMRIISYAMLCILQLAMSVPYRNCYAVGCTMPYNPFSVPNRVRKLPYTNPCVITECSIMHYNKSCRFFFLAQFLNMTNSELSLKLNKH